MNIITILTVTGLGKHGSLVVLVIHSDDDDTGITPPWCQTVIFHDEVKCVRVSVFVVKG